VQVPTRDDDLGAGRVHQLRREETSEDAVPPSDQDPREPNHLPRSAAHTTNDAMRTPVLAASPVEDARRVAAESHSPAAHARPASASKPAGSSLRPAVVRRIPATVYRPF